MMMILFSSFASVFFLSWSSVSLSLMLMFIFLLLKSNRFLDWNNSLGDVSLDGMSWILSILSVWIVFLIILNEISKSEQDFSLDGGMFRFFLLTLLLILLLAFSTLSIMKFYMWFELSLFPTFLLILGWGYQPERMKATLYLVLYTVFASLPLLLSFSFLTSEGMYFFMQLNLENSMNLSWNSLLFLGCILAFLVKLPLYFSHLWLIKAHVEAPVAGSMILASILLKLGGYGLVRVRGLLEYSNLLWNTVMVWALMGGVFVSFLCMRSKDVKVLIALSSVAHMGLVAGGVASGSFWGVNGAILIMVGHGFCSSGLFCIANMSYIRAGSRSFKIMKGSQILFPSLTLWWFLLVISNMAAPPSINLLGEIHSILALTSWSWINMFLLAILVFMAAAYSLALFVKSQHGKSGESMMSSPNMGVSPNESLTLLLHWFPLNILILKWSTLGGFLG